MKVESLGVLWSQIISVENPLNDSYTPGGLRVNFCWVYAAGFSGPLTHHSLMVDPVLVTFGKIGTLRD